MRARIRRSAALLLLAAPLGCFAPAPGLPPFEAPEVGRDVTCWRGTPLSGPRPLPDPGDAVPPGSALQVTVRVLALERRLQEALHPLPVRTEMIAALGSGAPLVGVCRYAWGARVGEVRDAEAAARAVARGELGRSATMGENVAALPPGVTVSAQLSRDLTRPPGLPPARESVALLVGRSDDGEDLQVALVVDAGLGPRGEPQGELHLLRPFTGRERLELALAVPAPFGEVEGDEPAAEGRAPTRRPRPTLLLLVSVTPAPAPGTPGYASHQRAYAACLGDLARTRVIESRVDLDPCGLPPAPDPPPPLNVAMVRRRLGDPARARAVLIELGWFAGAELTAEAALSLDDLLAAGLAKRVSAALGRPGAPEAVGPELTWLLEREAAGLFAGERIDPVHPGAQALLARHVGALGALPGRLQATLEAEDLEAWRELVLRENLALLEDGLPGLRVRAWEWLVAHGAAPEGYHPLAPLEERTRALVGTSGIAAVEAARENGGLGPPQEAQ